MNGQAQRLLPALLIALVLHGVLLSRRMGENRAVPAAKAMQRITVSLETRTAVKMQLSGRQQLPPSEEKKEVVPPVKPVTRNSRESPVPPIHIPKPSLRKSVVKKKELKSKPQSGPAFSTAEKKTQARFPVQEAAPSSLPKEQKENGDPQVAAPAAAPVLRQAIPLYQVNPPPEYPPLARRRGIEGVVLLEALVDISGKVADLRVSASSGHAVLDRAAIKGAQRWRFTPGTIDGRQREMWVKIPIRFQLQGSLQ